MQDSVTDLMALLTASKFFNLCPIKLINKAHQVNYGRGPLAGS